MSFLLLTGIVLTAVPIILIIGFAGFIFLSFIRDDSDASMILRVVLITMFFGIVLIAMHFLREMAA